MNAARSAFQKCDGQTAVLLIPAADKETERCTDKGSHKKDGCEYRSGFQRKRIPEQIDIFIGSDDVIDADKLHRIQIVEQAPV